MPHANSQGVRIHYEIEGSGPPVVLQHGITLSLGCWAQFGYVDALREKHRLILIDARAHGESDTPADLALCNTEAMAGDVLAVMEHCGVERAHYIGYSMGGWIGFLLAGLAPERLQSLIVGGAHCYADDLSVFRDTLGRGMGAWIELCEANLGTLPDALRQQYETLDPRPLQAIVQHDRPAIPKVLDGLTIPCLLWVGEQDPRQEGVRRCAKRLPQAQLVSLPGVNHMEALVRGDLVVPSIVAFLAHH
jgi:pimeloyl-ACP methyl ester carboxylesterase